MKPYFKELLHIFNEHGVEYLVIGAHAVMHYTEPRFTKDHDVWVNPTEENAKKVFASLAEFGVPLSDATWEDFAVEGTVYQIGTSAERIDVLTKPSGLKFTDCWVRREDVVHGELRIHVIGKGDLIENKRLCGRPQDLLDLEKIKNHESE
ncbi:MAG: hypothetical protein ABFD69_02620 [Candidatus Sumerlaeia bacterium]